MDFQYLFFAIFITMDCATSLRRFFTFQIFIACHLTGTEQWQKGMFLQNGLKNTYT